MAVADCATTIISLAVFSKALIRAPPFRPKSAVTDLSLSLKRHFNSFRLPLAGRPTI
jgi:hypothetical protein